MKTIIISPVKRQSVQKRHLQRFQYRKEDGTMMDGAPLDKNKVVTYGGKSATETLIFQTENNKVQAGLEQVIDNPYYLENEEDKSYEDATNEVINRMGLSSQAWFSILKIIIKNPKISLQRHFEILDGVDPETYTQDIQPKRGSFFKPEGLTFLQRFTIALYDNTNIFKDDTSRGRFAIQLAKMRSDKIASSKQDINTAQHSFYISEEEESVKENLRLSEITNTAIVAFMELQSKYPNQDLKSWPLYKMANILKYKNNSLVKGAVSSRTVIDSLDRFIKSRPSKEKFAAQEFINLYQMYKDNKELFEMKYLTTQGFEKGVLGFNSGRLFWYSQKSNPQWYSFSSEQNFIQFLYGSYQEYNPKEPLMENGYKKFIEELKERNAVI